MGGGAKKPLGWFQAKVEAASTSGASTIGPFPPSLPRDLWRFLSSPAAQRLTWIYGDFDKFGVWTNLKRDESGLRVGHPARHRHRPRHRRPCFAFLLPRLVLALALQGDPKRL